jgi:hypothetical protein
MTSHHRLVSEPCSLQETHCMRENKSIEGCEYLRLEYNVFTLGYAIWPKGMVHLLPRY